MWSGNLVIVLLAGLWSVSVTDAVNCTLAAKGNRSFPADFKFGVSTAAYQIEGAWDADGKGPSIWDEFTHKYPDNIKDRSNGDIAADSYNRFDLDLQALKDLKVDFYRFSIAWPRIYPNGDISSRNQKGIDYYNTVIDKLLANGIEPVVTMVHYDLPVEVQKLGGFTNSLFVDQFETYANELFESFGDRVKTWITFNEPIQYCTPGYGIATYPPKIDASGIGDYLCVLNTLKAHAATYRLYRSKFFEKQQGKIGITLNSPFYYSKTNNTSDVERGLQFAFGILANPIFSPSGGFAEFMVKDIETNSLKEGRKKSRLPRLEGEWKDTIKGSADFLGLNYYTSSYIERSLVPVGGNPSVERDQDCNTFRDPNWPRGKSDWLFCVPEGLEDLLKYIRDSYKNVEVIITENGWSDDGDLEDDGRIRYLKSHVQAVLNAVNDGCNVSGYTHWSLIDNFEWLKGYTEKFGLYSVNMKSPKRERTPRKSVGYFRKIIETRTVPDEV